MYHQHYNQPHVVLPRLRDWGETHLQSRLGVTWTPELSSPSWLSSILSPASYIVLIRGLAKTAYLSEEPIYPSQEPKLTVRGTQIYPSQEPKYLCVYFWHYECCSLLESMNNNVMRDENGRWWMYVDKMYVNGWKWMNDDWWRWCRGRDGGGWKWWWM